MNASDGTDIRAWLRELDLEQYADAFIANDIDASLVATLTRDDLTDIGVSSVGHRRRILDAIARRKADGAASADPAEAPAMAPQAARADGAERRNLTILMCDMVRSTEIAARHDPEQMRDVIELFQNVSSGAIARFGGYVAKFMGDAVLAYFGYPNALENDAECALRAGLAIVDRLAKVAPSTGEPISARVGVATGLVVVGDLIGEGSARERAVVGDTPSMAERMQRLAEPGSVLCGSSTRRLASDHFDYEDRGRHELKGFDMPIHVWRVVGERAIESRFAATRLARMSPMVGRAQEKALLRERWETTRDGEGQLVLLTGDAGIGKSRLVRDFTEDIAGGAHFRLAMQCSPHFTDSALFPAIRQLELSAGFSTTDDIAEKRRKLAALLDEVPGTSRYLGELEALLSLRPDDPSEEAAPDTMRRRFMQALVGRIETAAARRPVLFQFEDAHWMDPSTEEFLTNLIERLDRLPVLLIVTYRHEFACPWVNHADATVLKLNRLNRHQSAELVRELVGDALPPQLVDEIVERTDGVPLFLEEVSRALLETGVHGAAAAPFGASPDGPIFAVPATLHDTLLSRLDRDEGAKRVAQIASVIGREFRYALLAAVAPIGADELRQGLGTLLDSGLVMRQQDVTEELYSFKHGLLHQATYDTILLRRRQELHLAIAQALEREFRDIADQRPEVVAWHFHNAGQVERAAQVWLQAGRLALTRGAYDEASRHVRAGLAALGGLEAGHQRNDLELPLQIALAETLRSGRLTGGDEALTACRRARELCDELGDIERLVRVLRLEFGINFNRPDVEAAQWVADAFLKVGEKHGNKIALMLGRQGRGSLAFFRGEFARAREEFAAGLDLREAADERRLIAQYQFPTNSLVYLAISNFLLGACDEAEACLNEAIELARRSSTFAMSLTLANAMILFRMMGADEAAREPLETLREIAGARGAPFWVDLVGFHDGWGLARTGQATAGLARMAKAIDTFSANAVEIEVPFYEALIAGTCVAVGETGQALEFVDDALARIERTGELWCQAELHRIRALATVAGDPAAAAEALAEARRIAEDQNALLWQLRIAASEHALAADDRARAAARARLGEIAARIGGGEGLADIAAARAILDG